MVVFMFGIGMVKTPVSQRTKINKWVYFVVIKTVFKDKRLFVYNRSQDFFHLSIKKIIIGYHYSLRFVLLKRYILIYFIQSNLKPG